MLPTYTSHTRVLVSKISYVFVPPRRGDIIIIKHPTEKKELIKRIAQIKGTTYFVRGDNKKQSIDSKTFGWIEKKDIIGKVLFIL